MGFLWELAAVRGVPIARDMELFFVPWKFVVSKALRAGHLPLWTPYMGLGVPTLADFQSAVFYPPTWLFAALPFLTAFDWLVVLHLVVGGVFCYLFARETELSPEASTVAGVSFMLGGYLVSLTNLINVLQAAAWAPALGFVLLRHLKRWRPSTWLVVVVVYALGFLAGEPQTFVLAGLVAFGYAVVWSTRRERTGLFVRRILTTLATAGVVALGLVMVQVLPTLEFVRNADRGAGLPYSEIMKYSLEPVRLMHLLVPNDFHDPVYRFGQKSQLSGLDPWLFSVYVGVGAVAVGCFSLAERARRREVLFWLALAVVGVVLALGRFTPVLPWLYRHVPGLGAFRYPEKFFLLTGLAVPMLAAFGFDVLGAGRRGNRAAHAGLLTLLAVLLALKIGWGVAPAAILDFLRVHQPAAFILDHFPYGYVRIGQDLTRVALFAVVAAAILMVREAGWLRRGAFAALVVAVVALDFWTAHRHLTPTADPSFYRQEPEISASLPMRELQSDFRYFSTPFDKFAGSYYSVPGLSAEPARWLWKQMMAPNTGVLQGVYALDAADAIHPSVTVDMQGLFKSLPPEYSLRLLRLSSVTAIYNPHAFTSPVLAGRVPVRSLNGYVYSVRDPVPRAHLAHGRLAGGPMKALNTVLAEGFDPRTEVSLLPETTGGGSGPPLQADPAAASAGAAPPSALGSARLVSDRGPTVRVAVSPDTASYLVLHDLFYPGWHAYVDGRERPIHRADYFFRAVSVDRGDREVVFRYEPRSLVLGARISLAAAAVLLLGVWGWSVARWRRSA